MTIESRSLSFAHINQRDRSKKIAARGLLLGSVSEASAIILFDGNYPLLATLALGAGILPILVARRHVKRLYRLKKVERSIFSSQKPNRLK